MENSNVYELKDIPKSEVDQIVKMFEKEGCTTQKIKQPNGKWTVRATCPEKKKTQTRKRKHG
jgi:hypothetical protein